jgi:hypothetical protein
MEIRMSEKYKCLCGLKMAANSRLAITAALALVAVIPAGPSHATAADHVESLTLCVSRKGEPEPPVLMQINQRPASVEFTTEKAEQQYQGIDLLLYEDWIPDYYFMIRPPSRSTPAWASASPPPTARAGAALS